MQKRILKTLEQCRYSVLTERDDLEKVYKLRYSCYRAENSISLNKQEIMHDSYDQSPNCIHVALEMGGTLVSAVRLHLITPLMQESPTLEVFPEILGSADLGSTLLDPTRFVVHPDARKMRVPIHFLTLRIPFLAAMFYDVETALAPVRPEHVAFYQRYLGYKLHAEPRVYPGLKNPVALLAADFQAHRYAVLAKYPFFGHVAAVPQSEINFPDLVGKLAAQQSPAAYVA